MKRHPVCITSTHTAYATIDTTIIHHVYNFPVCVPISSTGSWDLFAIKSVAVFSFRSMVRPITGIALTTFEFSFADILTV